ncbi:hypothetical protein LTR84_012016 [Exophiala bonariae]|uniref:Major facilitator superfamily (MFS) profile domain-containing protein n=1 Tax=Exophiala bonariae TaxID=1690606 RepID=A0AAV9MRN2_9EURO|nr:hypothetical protein LTR84_012016 [Exophiala bonariae]
MAEAKQRNTPPVSADEKVVQHADSNAVFCEHHEGPSQLPQTLGNVIYINDEEEPELHLPTWIALGSIYLLLAGQGLAFQGPPAVLSFIGADLGNTNAQTWVPNALALVQAVIGPVISSASDIFQVRKPILVASCTVALIGTAIAPGATDIYRVIGAQALIGVGLAAVPLSYVVPSEILPRKWRPMVQASTGVVAAITAMAGPLTVGALTKRDPHTGWRLFYWIMFAIWGAAAVGIIFGYRPPKRHTRLDHLSFSQKLGHLDLPGFGLLAAGLTLFSVGLSLGGGLYSWTDAHTLATLISGFFVLLGFGFYEWKCTKNGILNHELFRGGKNGGRIFGICNGLMVIEAVLGFPFIIFYSVVTTALFTRDPFMVAVRLLPFWGAFLISCPLWGFLSTKFRTIREPLFLGFLLFTVGNIGMATLNPGDNASQLAFAAVAGIGFGSPLILIIAGVQLSTPHQLIATATAITNSARAVGGTIFTAAYTSALSNSLSTKIPTYIADAAARAGLPGGSIATFIGAIVNGDAPALSGIPGVNSTIIQQGFLALEQAYADSLRLIYIIAAPFGIIACILCLFLGDLEKTMTYRVDAPIEDLHARLRHDVAEPEQVSRA